MLTNHRAYTLYVGNLRNTGHLTEATPPAAKADEQAEGRQSRLAGS